jgi:hypothetical protein
VRKVAGTGILVAVVVVFVLGWWWTSRPAAAQAHGGYSGHAAAVYEQARESCLQSSKQEIAWMNAHPNSQTPPPAEVYEPSTPLPKLSGTYGKAAAEGCEAGNKAAAPGYVGTLNQVSP